MRSTLRLVSYPTLALAVTLLAACGDSTGPDTSAVAGTWTLQTANGQSLPTDLVENGTEFTLISGTLILGSDGTCTNNFVTDVAGSVTLDCTFTLNGTAFTYTEPGDVVSGTVSGNTMTLNNDGNTLVYTR